jgi:hypothetical protein
MPIAAARASSRDQGHRRAMQSLLSDKLPRADRHHLGLRRRLDEIDTPYRIPCRQAEGGTPIIFLKARLKAASDS